jgi:hypothetical protein
MRILKEGFARCCGQLVCRTACGVELEHHGLGLAAESSLY